MIGRLIALCLLLFSIGGAGLYWASRKSEPEVRQERWTKFITYFCVVHIVLLSALLGPRALVALFVLLVLLGAFELYKALHLVTGGRAFFRIGTSLGYFLLASGLLLFLLLSTKELAIFVYLVVATFDGFSQVIGNMIGTHPLVPRISPGKTIEGSLGGMLFAALMAGSLHPLVGMTTLQALSASTWIVVVGFFGDLLASWVKRVCGVKDFGRSFPGHGGVLDRFDSFLLVGPAALFLLHQSKF
jgi:phosphatidate cytidylyltransferase